MSNSVDGVGHESDGGCAWLRVTAVGSGRFRLVGELDLVAAPTLCAALAGCEGDIELECSELTFIDVAGIRALLAVDEACRRLGAKLSIVNPSRPLRRLVDLGGFALALNGCVQNVTP
jgi:anti-anti-sigma factor